MKLKFLVLSVIIAFAACEIGTTSREDATAPEDISAFRAIHENEDHVLFFHDSSDTSNEGFFQSIFGIFGSNSELDEEYQLLLSEKYPTLEIDGGIDSLKNVKDDFQVPELPYIIAYHKGKEIWREQPSKDSVDIIENRIIEKDGAQVATYPKAQPAPAPTPQKYILSNTPIEEFPHQLLKPQSENQFPKDRLLNAQQEVIEEQLIIHMLILLIRLVIIS